MSSDELRHFLERIDGRSYGAYRDLEASYDMGRFELGISASGVAWASRWLSDKAMEGRVRLVELREG